MAETAEAFWDIETEQRPLLSLTDFTAEQMTKELIKGLDDIEAGRVFSEEEVDAWLFREYGI